MLTIANVVTVPLSGSSTNSEVGFPVAGSAPCGGKYTLPVFPVLAPTSLPWAMARRYALSSYEAVC